MLDTADSVLGSTKMRKKNLSITHSEKYSPLSYFQSAEDRKRIAKELPIVQTFRAQSRVAQGGKTPLVCTNDRTMGSIICKKM